MPWTHPIIYSVGQRLHASDMNLISDNLRETAPAKATAARSLFYSDGPNSIALLQPPASNGLYILRSGVTTPAWVEVLRTRPASLTGVVDDSKPVADSVLDDVLVRKNRVMFWNSSTGSRSYTVPKPYAWLGRNCAITGAFNRTAGNTGFGGIVYGTGDDVLTVNITAATGFIAFIPR